MIDTHPQVRTPSTPLSFYMDWVLVEGEDGEGSCIEESV